MALIQDSIRKIRQKGNADQAVSTFTLQMETDLCRLSSIRLLMNLNPFYESETERVERSLLASEITDSVHRFLNLLEMVREGQGDCSERASSLIELRKDVTKLTDSLFLLADRIRLTEYQLNRLEAEFIPEKRNTDLPSDAELSEKILNYIREDKQLTAMRMSDCLEQLPVRMTSGRFFELLGNAFQLYVGSDEANLENLEEELFSAAGLRNPEIGQEEFGIHFSKLSELEQLNPKENTAEEYLAGMEALNGMAEEVSEAVEQLASLQGLINDLLTMQLSGFPKAMPSEEQEIIHTFLETLLPKMKADFEEVFPEELFSLYEKLEGKQETLLPEVEEGFAYLPELLESEKYSGLSEENKESLERLRKASLLIGESLYADLEKKESSAILTKEATLRHIAEAELKFKDAFTGISKRKKRALMSAALAVLPPFIRDADELEQYILNSLSSCTDLSEKIACREILEAVMLG